MTLWGILYVFLCVSIVLGEPNPKSFIVGGRRASIYTFPYQVSLRLNGRHFCAASIISENCLLTAAHCCKPKYLQKLTIHVGTSYQYNSNGTTYKFRKAYVYKEFDRRRGTGDIALIEVYGPIKFDDTVQPVKLATRNPAPGTMANIAGWGYVNTDKTKKLDQIQSLAVNILSYEECKKYDPIYPLNPDCVVERSHVCTLNTSGEGICQGDSGGPLVAGGIQYGLVSFNAAKCAINLPDVHTNVAYYRDWIYETCGV